MWQSKLKFYCNFHQKQDVLMFIWKWKLMTWKIKSFAFETKMYIHYFLQKKDSVLNEHGIVVFWDLCAFDWVIFHQI